LSSSAAAKRYTEAAKTRSSEPVALDQAVTAVKAFKATKFDQSVELIFSLGIDPKQADQMIRGSLSLPHGIGKSKRVVAFCPDHLAPVATPPARSGPAGRSSSPRSRRRTSPTSTSPSPLPT
jgi:ribosomal protein L1